MKNAPTLVKLVIVMKMIAKFVLMIFLTEMPLLIVNVNPVTTKRIYTVSLVNFPAKPVLLKQDVQHMIVYHPLLDYMFSLLTQYITIRQMDVMHSLQNNKKK